jgi:hypothetical protein
MKKIFIIPTFILLLFAFSACETQDSLDPRPVINAGQYVRLDITNRLFSIDHLEETVFGGKLTAPGGNVVKYELFVRRANSSGVITGNYVKLLTVTTFPSQLSITPEMIATALGISAADLQYSDVYRFLGYSYNANGVVADYNNLSATVKTQASMKQGYKFMTTMSQDSNIINLNLTTTFNNYQL